MDGIHPLRLCGVWNGGGVCCAVLVCSVRVAQPASRPSQCSTRRYCCRVMLLFVAGRVVCVGVCLSVLVAWWGILRRPSPIRGGGWHCVVGWHGDGRAAVSLGSPSAYWCPPHVCSVAVLNGGVCLHCGVPVFGLGPPFRVVPRLFCLALPCLCGAGECGGMWWWCWSCSSLPSLCLLSQHCWFSVVCLWKGGACGGYDG